MEDIPQHIIEALEETPQNWQTFGTLWEWAIKQEWWGKFYYSQSYSKDMIVSLINPKKFSNAIYKFRTFSI